MAFLLSARTAYAADEDVLYRKLTWTLAVGYSRLSLGLDLPRDLRIHANHPDDPWVGDPGQTTLDKIDLDVADLEVGPTFQLGHRNVALLVHYVAKIPISPEGRDEIQQINDPRPPSQGSYIYTKLDHVDVGHSLRAGIAFASLLSPGQGWWFEAQGLVDVGVWNMAFEKGWTRFGLDEAETASSASGRYLSPKVKGSLTTERWAFYVTLGYAQIVLDYDDRRLASHSASGFEAGLGGSFRF